MNRRRQDVLDTVHECSDDKGDEGRQARIVERDGRRRRRRELRSKTTGRNVYYEGQSSDDEILQSMKMKFQSEIGELIDMGQNV